MINDVGYVVVLLKRQENEESMPDSVKVNIPMSITKKDPGDNFSGMIPMILVPGMPFLGESFGLGIN